VNIVTTLPVSHHPPYLPGVWT